MKVAFFSTKSFEQKIFTELNNDRHQIEYITASLCPATKDVVSGYDAVCAFVNDDLSSVVLNSLNQHGIKLIVLRSAGFNHVDLITCEKLGIKVTRVPDYSPYAVAEHAVALLLCLNRKIHKAYNRVREGNFSLDGLIGIDMHGKTIGILGTGKIGSAFAKIMLGFGCNILAYDIKPDENLVSQGVKYVDCLQLCKQSHVVSLHMPLNKTTKHIIDTAAINQMKDDVIIINTSRGGLIDTAALITGLKSGKVKAAGLDVYEEEESLFFHDLSDTIIQDDQITRLMTFHNVIITAHQGFLTKEALRNIALTTIKSLDQFSAGQDLSYQVV